MEPLIERRRQAPKPTPIRAQSAMNMLGSNSKPRRNLSHLRHKSSTTSISDVQLGVRSLSFEGASSTETRPCEPQGASTPAALGCSIAQSIPSDSNRLGLPIATGMISPPTTPLKSAPMLDDYDEVLSHPTIDLYDFEKLDYELQRARVLGKGLWSTVLLADGKRLLPEQKQASSWGPLTPPTSPQKVHHAAPSSVFAVKVPARADAISVFKQEAMILTSLMRIEDATQYVVTFHGLDMRNHALVFEAVIGGSLESLEARLSMMTEVSRHVELVSIFPGIAYDLVSGLVFLHAAGVVHADIKSANVLLDIYDDDSRPHPVIRARYIDFSASFRQDSDDSRANAGGTWDYMAPEQISIKEDLNTPTFASDVWSLGITLLHLMVGGSPYAAACGNNAFMLREAIKTGGPLGFARMSIKAEVRMTAAQDFVDCCKYALSKDRERRPTAAVWKAWLVAHELGG